MNANDQNRNKENIVINQITITSNNALNVTAINDGPTPSQLIWLGIFNETTNPQNQTYQKLNNVLVGPGQTVNIVSNVTVTSGNQYLIQLVTELGNTVDCNFYSANYVSCALTLVTAPPTVYQGNNVTVLLTVTANNTLVNSIQSLTATITATPTGLVQLVSNSPLSVTGLTQGTSAFFWWVYNAVSTGTVSFNASYVQAPAGTYALSTAQIVSPPQQGAQGSVTITGVNCTACQNPSQWNLLGSTQNISGSISSLASNDTNYASFSSYYSPTSINHFVNSNSSNVDNVTNLGTQSNFPALQQWPSQTYDNLTEAATNGSTSSFGNPSIGSTYTSISANYLYGQSFTSPANAATVYNVTFYGRFSYGVGSGNVKAVLVLQSNLSIVTNGVGNAVSIGTTAGWYTSTFSTPPTISPNTAYVLMIIPDTTSFRLYYTSTSGGSEYDDNNNNYSSPTNPTHATNGTHQYSIYCNCSLVNYRLAIEVQWTAVENTQQNAQLCVYAGNMSSNALGVDYWNGSSWINLCSSLNASGWNNITVTLTGSIFSIRFEAGIYSQDVSQGSWNISATLLHLWTNLYTAQVEFIDCADLQNWTQIAWFADSNWNTSAVNVTEQLYNYALGNYPSSGDGYVFYIANSTITDYCFPQTITTSPTNFRNSTGYWNVEITGVASTQFQMNVNWIELRDSYAYINDTIPYKSLVWYTIQATAANGNPIPFTYASIYANGTTVTLQNATSGASLLNPAWVQLDANGEFQLQLGSTTSSGETFVLYVAVGTVVQQKTITQAAQQ